VATAMGPVDLVKLLLDKAPRSTPKDNRGETALHYAVMTASIEEAKLLLDKGAAIDSKTGTAHPAYAEHRIRLAGSGEVAAGPMEPNVEAKDSNGFTSLMAARRRPALDGKALLDTAPT